MTFTGADLIAAIDKFGWITTSLLAALIIGVVIGFILLNKRIGESDARLASSLGREDYRFTKLLERRVDTVCEIYERLVGVHQHVVSLVHPWEPAGGLTKQEKAMVAQASLDAFNEVYYPNRIWLDALAVEAVDAFVGELMQAALKYQTARATDNAEVWVAAWEQADKKSAPALRSIEDLFRRILIESPQGS